MKRALVVAAVIVSCITGCGASNTATPSDVDKAWHNEKIDVCSSGTRDSQFEGAGTAKYAEISRDCSKSDQSVLVGLIPFKNTADRDAAFKSSVYRLHYAPNNVAALTFGDSIVVISQIKDRDLANEVIQNLKDRGAQ